MPLPVEYTLRMSQELAEAANLIADMHAEFARRSKQVEDSLADDVGAQLAQLRDTVQSVKTSVDSISTSYPMGRPQAWCSLAAESAEAAQPGAALLAGTSNPDGQILVNNTAAGVAMAERWAVEVTDRPWQALPNTVSSSLAVAVEGLNAAMRALREYSESISAEAVDLAGRSAIATAAYIPAVSS